jgi:hypothetical protein
VTVNAPDDAATPEGTALTRLRVGALRRPEPVGPGDTVSCCRFNGSANKGALTKFATCMRENGVNLPAPNTSGKGPVFDTKGIDTTSAAFKSAQQKCRAQLKGAFRGAGAPPSSPGEGGPPGEGPPAGEA